MKFGFPERAASPLAAWVRRLRAFTLIEMLVVIAIIGILAGILIPAVAVARRQARINVAKSDIKSIVAALTNYQLVFGAFPPDHASSMPPFPPAVGQEANPYELNPNELLVWYLTRTYSPNPDTNGDGLGRPAGWHPGTNPDGDWNPTTAVSVFCRQSIEGGLDVKAKQRRDFNGNGYPEFLDPWGRPYLYRAYMAPWAEVEVNATTGSLELTTDAYVDPGQGNSHPHEDSATAEIEAAYIRNSDLTNVVGVIEISGIPGLSGAFSFEGTGNNTVKIQPGGTWPAAGTKGKYRFQLHNRQTCDIYSLGPNGRTRANQRPAPSTQEWRPQDEASLNDWREVWGTPGDGNDIDANGNIVSETERDDISSWQ